MKFDSQPKELTIIIGYWLGRTLKGRVDAILRYTIKKFRVLSINSLRQ